MKRSWIGIACFALVLLLLSLGSIRALYAQATAGFTKINTAPVTTASFTTGTLTDGVAYNFEVTGVNSAGVESTASNIATAIVPATGTHTATITWTPGANDATFNVYDQQVAAANPPGAVSVTIN
jgi:hypothetical protein